MHEFQYVALFIALAVVGGAIDRFTRSSRKRRSGSRKKSATNGRSNVKKGSGIRSDEVILHSRLEDLNWAEFERLLYLYFTDQGYQVIEQGVGGNDGGVDLILVDKRTNERTAVQAKHWAHGPVGPNVIRELSDSRRNMKPMCLYAMLITSNDVTQQARDEARARHMEFLARCSPERQVGTVGQVETGQTDCTQARQADRETCRKEAGTRSNVCLRGVDGQTEEPPRRSVLGLFYVS